MQGFNAPGMTKWTCPVNKPAAKLKLYKGPPVIIPHQHEGFPGTVKDTGYLEVTIPPGESCLLPSGFDSAIQSKDANGIVQSGACPWLIRDDVEPVLHESLDPIEQQRLQAEKDAEAARAKGVQAAAEEARAKALKEEAERLQRENDERAKADQAAREKLNAELAEVTKMKEELAAQLAQAKKATEDAKAPAESAEQPKTEPKGKAGK